MACVGQSLTLVSTNGSLRRGGFKQEDLPGLAIGVAVRNTPAAFAHAKALAALVDTAEALKSVTPFQRVKGLTSTSFALESSSRCSTYFPSVSSDRKIAFH